MVIRVNDRLRGVHPYSRSIEFLTIWRYNRIRAENFPHLYLPCLYLKPEALTLRSDGVWMRQKLTRGPVTGRRFKMCHEQGGFARRRLPVYYSPYLPFLWDSIRRSLGKLCELCLPFTGLYHSHDTLRPLSEWLGYLCFFLCPPSPSPTAAKYRHTECTGTETYDRSSALVGYYKEGVKNIPRKLFLLINMITRKGLYKGWISNDDGDGNGNGKKAIGFISAKQQLCSYQVFLYIF